MFEQAFKNIDDVLWKEAGCITELDYTEQTSWLLFLKQGGLRERMFEARLEHRKKMAAENRRQSSQQKPAPHPSPQSHRYHNLCQTRRKLPNTPLSKATFSSAKELIPDAPLFGNRANPSYQRKLAALDELKKSLLHQAFTGML